MQIIDVKKEEDVIIMTLGQPSDEWEAEFRAEATLRTAHDLRRLNGGKAVRVHVGEGLTLLLDAYDQTLNSDIVREETVE